MGQVVSRVRRRRTRIGLIVAALLPILVFGLSACGGDPAPEPPEIISDKGTPYDDLLVPKLTASVKDGDVDVAVDTPVEVTAEDGVLGSVTMVNDYGRQVDGALSTDGRVWSTTEPLGYNKRYTVNATALGLAGATTKKLTFRTHSPANLAMPYAYPSKGEVVGVGQPVMIRFDENISDRTAAEKAITVTTEPEVEGAFYWLNNRELRWRPEHYWKPGTEVAVKVDTYGVDLGDGVFGQDSAATEFTIGDEVIATADDKTKMITVRVNGEVVKTMPTSMGKDATPTDNGTYIVGERFEHMVMDSSTYGVPVNSPDGYRTEVDWATQMSYSGIYVHSAPWSIGAQGNTNTSHGCLNVSPTDAIWFYDHTKRGDLVEVVNTVGPTLPGTDGLGDWNIPWSQWEAGNADA
ncbi:L,D-transpeptidase [Mycolicibacillus parakoreensis]|uniref:Ig-like domain-containing protein n=1 Tax=Mycolicibacillus parakoreensis TaxID=1069221 RepID=A0ABY3U1B4_9MYCO|nr:Ig-like domain-containing protein [Mycolicibacillus parakoreensis]MCV7314763.1 L,D-transpeptidase [Mycolicibacillus parakoreensis]ULN53767.1 Ig-like domain-containing protein [Mycolicibacillus parakoreensis]